MTATRLKTRSTLPAYSLQAKADKWLADMNDPDALPHKRMFIADAAYRIAMDRNTIDQMNAHMNRAQKTAYIDTVLQVIEQYYHKYPDKSGDDIQSWAIKYLNFATDFRLGGAGPGTLHDKDLIAYAARGLKIVRTALDDMRTRIRKDEEKRLGLLQHVTGNTMRLQEYAGLPQHTYEILDLVLDQASDMDDIEDAQAAADLFFELAAFQCDDMTTDKQRAALANKAQKIVFGMIDKAPPHIASELLRQLGDMTLGNKMMGGFSPGARLNHITRTMDKMVAFIPLNNISFGSHVAQLEKLAYYTAQLAESPSVSEKDKIQLARKGFAEVEDFVQDVNCPEAVRTMYVPVLSKLSQNPQVMGRQSKETLAKYNMMSPTTLSGAALENYSATIAVFCAASTDITEIEECLVGIVDCKEALISHVDDKVKADVDWAGSTRQITKAYMDQGGDLVNMMQDYNMLKLAEKQVKAQLDF